MAGIHLDKPFPVYPECFPPEIIQPFEERIGRKTLGNCPASGTEIIQRLGDEHVRTGSPIVYTSADSVFQIAAHEDVIPVDELYRICEIAREMLQRQARSRPRDRAAVRRNLRHLHAHCESPRLRRSAAARHAARPTGTIAEFQFTASARSRDVFLGRGITASDKTKSNADGMAKTLAAMNHPRDGLIFVNLVDFDQNFGHRNDVEGYAKALEEVDAWLPSLLNASAARRPHHPHCRSRLRSDHTEHRSQPRIRSSARLRWQTRTSILARVRHFPTLARQ